MLWQTLGIGCLLCWAAAYTVLPSFNTVSPFVLSAIYGIETFVINLLVNLAVNGPSGWQQSWQLDAKQVIGSLAYSVFLTCGALLYLFASRQPNVLVSVLTAFTSSYFAISFVTILFIYGEYERLQIKFAVPGIILMVAGTILLSFGMRED